MCGLKIDYYLYKFQHVCQNYYTIIQCQCDFVLEDK